MKEFIFLYRNNYSPDFMPSPEQMQSMTQKWMDWMKGLFETGNIADQGNRLGDEGKVVKPGKVVTDGPYVEIKESLGGYTIVKANSLEHAGELAKGCPILEVGGNVEVRGFIPMN